MINRSSVPHPRVTFRASTSPGMARRERLACPGCGALVLAPGLCNRCRRNRASVGVAVCECGRERPTGVEACSRCSWLDASASSVEARRVVALLRSGSLTVDALVAMVGEDAMAELERCGRVVVEEQDVEVERRHVGGVALHDARRRVARLR